MKKSLHPIFIPSGVTTSNSCAPVFLICSSKGAPNHNVMDPDWHFLIFLSASTILHLCRTLTALSQLTEYLECPCSCRVSWAATPTQTGETMLPADQPQTICSFWCLALQKTLSLAEAECYVRWQQHNYNEFLLEHMAFVQNAAAHKWQRKTRVSVWQ